MNLTYLISFIAVSWESISEYFGYIVDVIFGNHLILGGLIILLFFIFLCLILFKGLISLLAVPILPLIFWLSARFALGDLLILVAIMVGILFGFALVRWYRR